MTTWDTYRNKRVIRKDLADIELPDFWLEVRHPKSLTSAEHRDNFEQHDRQLEPLRRLQEAIAAATDLSNLDDLKNEGEQDELDDIDPDTVVVPNIPCYMGNLITSWNLTDPETDELLPIPSKDDAGFGKLPGEVKTVIVDFISDLYEEADPKVRSDISRPS